MVPDPAALLIPSTARRDQGRLVGRDPRRLTRADLAAAGLEARPPMRAIRAYCLACAGAPGEVRKCVMTGCPLWPLRMGRWPGRLGGSTPAAVRPAPASAP
jgi:hypothetical protein